MFNAPGIGYHRRGLVHNLHEVFKECLEMARIGVVSSVNGQVTPILCRLNKES